MVFLSDGKEQNVGKLLYEEVRRRGVEATYISLDEKDIGPCRGCGSCSGPTFGKCIQNDDMQEVLKILSASRTWVMVCPIRFGNYSSRAKMTQERTSTLGDPRYYVERGELVKQMHDLDAFFAVGVKDHCEENERDVFLSLHRENVHIMNVSGEAFVVPTQPGPKIISHIAEVLIHE